MNAPRCLHPRRPATIPDVGVIARIRVHRLVRDTEVSALEASM
jgi:hypothetical protein